MTDIKRFLREYDGPAVRIMEVCGTHTAEISRNGIPGMLSEKSASFPARDALCASPSRNISTG